MQLKRLLSFFIAVIALNVSAQTPIDTITNENGVRIVVFSDRSEMRLDEMPFNGVMNQDLHAYLVANNFDHIQKWDNDVCFTSVDHYGIDKFSDTLELALSAAGDFVIPVPGIITSKYKYRWRKYHKGVDLNVYTGEPVAAAWAGKVRYAQYNRGGYGNLVIVRHSNGLETFYAHLSKITVQPNDEIKAGDIVGLGGSTGHSTGPHLHFEVRFFDASINPEEIIDFESKSLKKDNLLVYKDIFRPGALPTDELERLAENNNGISVAAVTNSAPRTVNNTQYYRVKAGDNLGKIAARNNTTITSICRLNNINRNSVLQVGRRLRIR